MRVLAIDQSYTHFAYVIVDGDVLESFDVLTTDKDKNDHQRAFYLAGKLVELIMLNKIEKVIFEDLAFGARGNATRSLAGLLYVLVHTVLMYNAMYDLVIDLDIISPKSLKKFATGNGNATKEDMVAAVPVEVMKQFKDSGFKKTTGILDLSDAWFLSQYNKKN